MKSFNFKEFRPTIFFLGKFLGLYLAGNLLYGLYITGFHPRPDPATRAVTEQTAKVISLFSEDIAVKDHRKIPNTLILHREKAVLAVYEGCNGINTMIVFLAFLVAFGPMRKTMLWFIPASLVIIHLANLTRIGVLFYVARFNPDYMYFTHKFLFTAVLYAVIFLLWVWWVKTFSVREEK